MTRPLCYYCELRAGSTNDHVIPRALHGPNHRWNLVPCCPTCNQRKGNTTYEQFTGRDLLPLTHQLLGYHTTQDWLDSRARRRRAVRLARKPVGDWKPGDPIERHPAWVCKVPGS